MAEEGGRTSEWNEGNFKSARLHEIQDNINSLKLDPTAIVNGKFAYFWLIKNLDNLYGEGYSKYSAKEREEVDRIRKLVYSWLDVKPPAKVIKQQSIFDTKSISVIDQKNLKILMELIDTFERKIKDLNDKHGLTTMNTEEHGDWDW